ncbi:MAG: translocation/assembly module TamB domain-containing protein, partial [Sediminibacterium sp.]|nr:translocation/assembly module TamB domain-containing protein [Sediminibacterium sp.]
VQGNVAGSVQIVGSLKNFYLQGNLLLKKAHFTVDYTNVEYEIDSANFEFNNKGIHIKKAIIKDFQHNIGYVEGVINHQNLKNFYYDINVNSENMMVLNTIKQPGDHFYGKAFAKSDFTIIGNENDLNFNLKAESKQHTFIHILNVDEKENGTLEFIRFKKSIVAQNKTSNNTRFKFSFNADLVLNNLAKIEVILDDVSNDIIECIGEGNIKLNISTFDPISMRGLYKIESGKYNLNFQSLIKTSFELTPNQNNFIEWTDKPLEANINIDARYKVDRINLNELIGSSNFSQNVKSYKGAIYVVAQLRDKMYKPTINFKLEFPIVSPTNLDNEFTQFLNRLEKDENEMLKQVSFLIIFQSFAPINSIAGNFNNTNYNYANLGYNT